MNEYKFKKLSAFYFFILKIKNKNTKTKMIVF